MLSRECCASFNEVSSVGEEEEGGMERWGRKKKDHERWIDEG
jgi:hypothetical protein